MYDRAAMGPAEIPEDVLRFIEIRIDSVPHLETLLLMWENRDDSWSEAQVCTRIYITRDQARSVLTDLVSRGFIEALNEPATGAYRFNSQGDEGQLLSRVAAAYRRHLIYLTGLIHAKASRAVLDFARAFEFKK
ncbi:MAG TPA: hypothetical protein VHZ53_19200 [Steroidobacteraceae bacterium]|jgi:predicted ArsR family transcriptional regulator|nr:hypothetical protein [Steroidobacteraceae bacterium]